MPTDFRKNYLMQWDVIGIKIVFLFYHAQLERIFDLLHINPLTSTSTDKKQPDFELEKEKDFFLLKKIESGEIYKVATLDELIASTVNQICWCFLEKTKRLILHSGAIVFGNEAILFSGLPRSGKTSLATYAWLANYLVIGDDLLVCDPENHTVQAFPRPLRFRVSSLNVPAHILKHAGDGNVIISPSLTDPGVFIGRKSSNILNYSQPIKIRALYYISRGEKTAVKTITRAQALMIGLTQVYPNQSCLEITKIIDNLDSKRVIKQLIIADNDYENALEKLCE